MAASTGNTLIARGNRFRVHSLAGCGCRIGFTTRLGYVLFRSATQRPVPRSPNVPACPLPTGSTRARCGPARLVPSRPNGRRRARDWAFGRIRQTPLAHHASSATDRFRRVLRFWA